jgi:D-sedoheptulose 7-phosphate isomerase
MKTTILASVNEAVKAMKFLQEKKSLDFIEGVALMIAECFSQGNKIIIAGNGGSLCDAAHFAEEFTGFFRSHDRKAYPALVLSEMGHMSCVSNDVGYDQVFVRGVEAFGKENDIFIVLTTSGNSKNLLLALEKAKEKKLKTIAFLGKSGGKTKGIADLEWIVEGFQYSDRIQEAHMTAIHIIIEIVEKLILEKKILTSETADAFLCDATCES